MVRDVRWPEHSGWSGVRRKGGGGDSRQGWGVGSYATGSCSLPRGAVSTGQAQTDWVKGWLSFQAGTAPIAHQLRPHFSLRAAQRQWQRGTGRVGGKSGRRGGGGALIHTLRDCLWFWGRC